MKKDGKTVRCMVKAVAIVAATLMAYVGMAQIQPLNLELTIAEPAGVDRAAENASGGIPLPEGCFKKDQAFALFEGAQEIPSQVLPLVTDSKGFLRWVLVDTAVDLKAGETKKLQLKSVPATKHTNTPLKVVEDPKGVTVDTGKIRFVISKEQPFSLLSSATVAGKPAVNGGEVSYTDAMDSKRYVADKPDSIVVEYVGALRTTICVRGRFVGDDQTKAQFIARITAWAGRSDIYVKYTLANSNPDHYCFRAVSDSTIALKLSAAPVMTTLGALQPIHAGTDGWIHSALNPGVANAVKAGDGVKELWSAQAKDGAVEGWMSIKTADGEIRVCDLYFADNPSRKLAIAKGSLLLTGIARRWRGELDDKNREIGAPYAPEDRWFHDCSHITSCYNIDFAVTGADHSVAVKADKNRLLLMAPPEWYSETAQLHCGRFGTQKDELACYDKWGWKYKKEDIPTAPGCRIPRYIASEDNHFESEHDNLDALTIMWLRTGGRKFYDAALAMANYYMDLQSWRTDGWRYRDGGVWWYAGPLGNRPQRGKDPVTGSHNGVPAPWAKELKEPWTKDFAAAAYRDATSKACYCHNWGEGLTAWFCLTGDRDAYDAAIDCVEQNFDTQKRAFKKEVGKTYSFSRDFTRSCYLSNATRLIAPDDEFVAEASDFLTQVYFQRPIREPRGMVSAGSSYSGNTDLKKMVGEKGVAAGEAAGVTFDPKTREVTETATGRKWTAIPQPNLWMYPPLSRAMDLYYRLTGNEDAMDFVIAYAQMASYVLWQDRHGLQHGSMLADWPAKGVVKDFASWDLPEGTKDGEGMKISGYLSIFHPDVCMHGYTYSGEEFLKQRAFDYWDKGSHRPYMATKMARVGEVGSWVNHYGPHSESVSFTTATFYEWSHPRKDITAPQPIADLKVSAVQGGGQVAISFTAPKDVGGKVARYQVKCSDKPLLDYMSFIKLFNENKDEEQKYCNWWMAVNVQGEPAIDVPGASALKTPGSKESFVVSGVPADAKYFAVVSFDDSSNRSGISNVVRID